MNAIKIICTIILVISSVITIVSVLMQSGESSGLGAIAGGAESFLGKTKAKKYESTLALATKVSTCVFIVMSLIVAAIS
ncbi:MAG: preprotein translocase subunit SecG [Oscillospiraceae bacterium]|jgi:preprotein translocase subunit SecG|nr:preprotein translocase subunit SecG [Oscillospiraceae bacterium]